MLSTALEFKEVFVRYADREPTYNTLPSDDDWKKVEDVCSFLALFSVATKIISGSEYPTSNLFLSELYGIKEALDGVALNDNDCMKGMAEEMKKKFDKYWGSCNLLISIGAVMDPRYKMKLIDFAFKEIYPEEKAKKEKELVQKNLDDLFKEYVNAYKEPGVGSNVGSSRNVNVESGSGSSSLTSRFGKGINTGSAKYAQHIRTVDCVESVKSELATYLEEGVYICEQGVYFNALGWWKENQLKYKILSKMAADILAIPVTTVASESAFSAGGRVIDPYRSCLGTKTVDMLICGADWYRHYYGLKKKKMKEDEDVIRVELT
ncbi:putative HAT dimerization domain, ribonuclease H-like superfamily, hAT-like transposase, RNase-H [Helianthus anomalus]